MSAVQDAHRRRAVFGQHHASPRETGIGKWTEAQFVERFKIIADANDSELTLNGRRNTEMPWRHYGGMTRGDLSAIYAYLRTVPAVGHVVPR